MNFSSMVLRIESSQSGLNKALPPTIDPSRTAPQPLRYFSIGFSIGEHQDESRTLNILGSKALRSTASSQFRLFEICKYDGLIGSEHMCSIISHHATHTTV